MSSVYLDLILDLVLLNVPIQETRHQEIGLSSFCQFRSNEYPPTSVSTSFELLNFSLKIYYHHSVGPIVRDSALRKVMGWPLNEISDCRHIPQLGPPRCLMRPDM